MIFRCRTLGFIISLHNRSTIQRYHGLIFPLGRTQGCNHRGDRCDCGSTYIFGYPNPISTKGGQILSTIAEVAVKIFPWLRPWNKLWFLWYYVFRCLICRNGSMNDAILMNILNQLAKFISVKLKY